jgi:hypothetical protein
MLVSIASKQVSRIGLTPNQYHPRSAPAFNPAFWALELSCDLKLEASKAIFRELRQIKLLVDLPFELLSFEKGALQVQTFISCALREISRRLPQHVLDRH